MHNYRNRFKCRCMQFYDQKTTGVWLMSGSYGYHISLTNLTQPRGLHRTFYQLIPEKKDSFLSDDKEEFDSCFKKVIYRYNHWCGVIPK